MSHNENNATRHFPTVAAPKKLNWEQDPSDRKKVSIHLPLPKGDPCIFLLEEHLIDHLTNLQSLVLFHIRLDNNDIVNDYLFDAYGLKSTVKATITFGHQKESKPAQTEVLLSRQQKLSIGQYAVSRKINDNKEIWVNVKGWDTKPTWFDLQITQPAQEETSINNNTEARTADKFIMNGNLEKPSVTETIPATEVIHHIAINDLHEDIEIEMPEDEEVAEKICPQCQNRVKTSARFCNRCRFDFTQPTPSLEPAKKLCSKCGKQANQEARFCNRCGFEFSKTCKKCKQNVDFTAKFCPHCGTSLETAPLDQIRDSVFCPFCGKEAKLPANFCPHCGKSFTRNGGAPQV